VLHVTEREGVCQTSTFGSQLTVRGDFCWDLSSDPQRRTELRRKREESMDEVLLLLLLLPLARRGFFGICRNHATESMLWAWWMIVPEAGE
jgi:hypothetical protein